MIENTKTAGETTYAERRTKAGISKDGVTLSSVRVDLYPDPDFPKSALARQVKRIGGSYSSCRGQDSSARYVQVPLSHVSGLEVLQELVKLRLSRSISRKPSLVFEVVLDLGRVDAWSGVPHPPAPLTVVNVVEGEDVQHLLERTIARLRTWGNELVNENDGILWKSDPSYGPRLRFTQLTRKRELVEMMRADLVRAEAELAELEKSECPECEGNGGCHWHPAV